VCCASSTRGQPAAQTLEQAHHWTTFSEEGDSEAPQRLRDFFGGSSTKTFITSRMLLRWLRQAG
jgi:hypothetical protein